MLSACRLSCSRYSGLFHDLTSGWADLNSIHIMARVNSSEADCMSRLADCLAVGTLNCSLDPTSGWADMNPLDGQVPKPLSSFRYLRIIELVEQSPHSISKFTVGHWENSYKHFKVLSSLVKFRALENLPHSSFLPVTLQNIYSLEKIPQTLLPIALPTLRYS